MSSPTASPGIVLLVGHDQYELAKVADFLGDLAGFNYKVALTASVSSEQLTESEVLIFYIDAQRGIDQETIDLWATARDRQQPRALLIANLEKFHPESSAIANEIDFDDIVLIANRVLDPVATPYLLLHNESGDPIGTICLDSLETFDHSQQPLVRSNADSELVELVSEFREEYLALRDEFGTEGFADGLLFPAIPLIINLGIGKSEINNYLELLTTRR